MAEKSTAFAVIGDRYHNSDYIRTALGKNLGARPRTHYRLHRRDQAAQRRNIARLQNADHLSRRHDLAPRLRCRWGAAAKCKRAAGAGGRSDRYRLDRRTTGAGGQRFRRRRRCRAVLSQFNLHCERQCDLSRGVRGSNRGGILRFDRSRSRSLIQTTPSRRVPAISS